MTTYDYFIEKPARAYAVGAWTDKPEDAKGEADAAHKDTGNGTIVLRRYFAQKGHMFRAYAIAPDA